MPHNGPFPSAEADRNDYYIAAVPYLTNAANLARLLVSTPNKNALLAAFTSWNNSYPFCQNPDTKTKTLVDNKNKADEAMQTALRNIYHDIPQSVLTTQDRNTLRIAPPAGGHHAPLPTPTDQPQGKIDSSARLEHTINISNSTTGKKAKPEGARATQIWEKIGGPAPVSQSEMTFVGSTSKSKYVNHFDGADAGKTVYYWFRYEGTDGTGPWSDMISAPING